MKSSLIARQQFWHFVFWTLALLASIPLLWPRILPRPWRAAAPHVCGYLIAAAVLLSFIVLCVCCVRMLARLHNLRTLGQIVMCGLQWLIACGLFAVLAYVADVDPPKEEILSDRKAPTPIARVEQPPPIPADVLYGPHALVIPIDVPDHVDDSDTSALHVPSHLLALEEKHPDLLDAYITKSPRWTNSKDDLVFFSQPWHVVMPVKGSRVSVHAAFISISVGQQVPSEYKIVKAGVPYFSSDQEHGQQLPDLALELGGAHYLLLAWRGPADPGRALSAINAAIQEVDKMVEPLAESPTQGTLEALCSGDLGTESIEEREPTILVSEPYAYSGFYQAQILANPGRAGDLIVEVEDSETHETLLHFEFLARFSHPPNELFRYDIPGDLSPSRRKTLISKGVIPDNNAPLFIIRRTPAHRTSPPVKLANATGSAPATDGSVSKPESPSASGEDDTPGPHPFDVSFKLFFRPAGHKRLEPVTSQAFRVISPPNQSAPQT